MTGFVDMMGVYLRKFQVLEKICAFWDLGPKIFFYLKFEQPHGNVQF